MYLSIYLTMHLSIYVSAAMGNEDLDEVLRQNIQTLINTGIYLSIAYYLSI
jgi:hypothetical protein